jgi:hypothetical protein
MTMSVWGALLAAGEVPRRDLLLAVVIAASAGVALVMDSGLESHVRHTLALADCRPQAGRQPRRCDPLPGAGRGSPVTQRRLLLPNDGIR